MICALGSPIDLKVFEEIHNLVVACKGERAGDTVVEVLDWARLDQMVAREKLHLCGHGDRNSVSLGTASYSPGTLADKLAARGLPAHIHSIRMHTCNSGTFTADPDEAFCARLHVELRRATNGFSIPVVGVRGPQVTTATGTLLGKDPAKRDTPENTAKRDAIMTKWAKKLTEWQGMCAKTPTTTQQEIVDGARAAAVASKAFFAELHAQNEHEVHAKPDARVWYPAKPPKQVATRVPRF